MSWLKWVPGRQDARYRKFCLWSFGAFRRGTDCYILEYPPHAILPEHRDPVEADRKHFRINIELRGQGEFRCERVAFLVGRCVGFRPDLYLHSMTNGPTTRRVLSIGFRF